MSILIKGMEMPSDCAHCFAAAIGYDSPLYSSCKLYCRAVDKFADCATVVTEAKTLGMLREYQGRPDWCPLVEIKTPHGRLIDADALMDKYEMMENSCAEHGRAFSFSFKDCGEKCAEWWTVQDALSREPTIIEAEGGGEDGN